MIDVMIEQKPVYVTFECKKCCNYNQIDYNSFTDEHGEYTGDWDTVICEACGCEEKIDQVLL